MKLKRKSCRPVNAGKTFSWSPGTPGLVRPTLPHNLRSYLKQNPMDLQLPGLDKRPLVEGGDFHKNCYYRLVSTGFPGIDSLLLICPLDGSPPILLIFRIARNAETHDVSEEGFSRINNLGLSPDTRKYYVVVTTEGVEPEMRVPEAYFAKGREKVIGKVSQVLNYPVPTEVLFPRIYI